MSVASGDPTPTGVILWTRINPSLLTMAAKAIHDINSYEHMETQLYFDANGKLIHDATFMDRLIGRFEGYKNNLFNGKLDFDSIEDHSMDDYRTLSMSLL